MREGGRYPSAWSGPRPVIWKLLMIAETRFRRLNAPELLKRVYLRAEYEDGIELARKRVAA